jgi:hypothetical protein
VAIGDELDYVVPDVVETDAGKLVVDFSPKVFDTEPTLLFTRVTMAAASHGLSKGDIVHADITPVEWVTAGSNTTGFKATIRDAPGGTILHGATIHCLYICMEKSG